MNKIYFSGKITGLDLLEAHQMFQKAESHLIQKYDCEIINPMKEIPYEKGKTWEQYMIDDIKLLFDCDAIYMLENWKESKGARIEFAIAYESSKKIMFADAL